MKLLSKLSDFFGGSLFKEVKETIMAYLPPDLNPVQRAEFELKTQALLNEKEKQANQAISESEADLNERIREQEGTASDLKTIPVIGHILIFARGAQRPIWGFYTMYLDYQYFSGGITFTPKQESAMWVINLLVLGFLFGERAIKNLMPLITQAMSVKAAK